MHKGELSEYTDGYQSKYLDEQWEITSPDAPQARPELPRAWLA